MDALYSVFPVKRGKRPDICLQKVGSYRPPVQLALRQDMNGEAHVLIDQQDSDVFPFCKVLEC